VEGFGICERDVFYESYIRLDVSNVVLVLNVHQQSFTYFGSIIEDCINFNVCFCNLNCLHIRREANQTAYYLAKYALHNLNCIWIEKTSPYIYVVLAFDLLSDFC